MSTNISTALIYGGNIEQDTVKNCHYRRVLATGKYMQMVVMSLKAMDFIELENHEKTDQFFRVEEGSVSVEINKEKPQFFNKDQAFIVPSGTDHKITALSDTKLYTIYAGEIMHGVGVIQETRLSPEIAACKSIPAQTTAATTSSVTTTVGHEMTIIHYY